MKSLLTILVILITHQTTLSQSEQPKGPLAVRLEALGPGGFGSASIDLGKANPKLEKLEYHCRIGLSMFPGDQNTGLGIVMIHTSSWTYGKENVIRPEFGAGMTITVRTVPAFWYRPHLIGGLRFQKPGRKLYGRIAYTPYISYAAPFRFQYQNWGSIGIGYYFRTRE